MWFKKHKEVKTNLEKEIQALVRNNGLRNGWISTDSHSITINLEWKGDFYNELYASLDGIEFKIDYGYFTADYMQKVINLMKDLEKLLQE